MTRPEDSVPFLIPSDRNQVKRTQGVIQQWNADTFENAVAFNGLTAFNVPVASGVEALTYQPGDVVLLEGYAPENATGSWMITGRVISPGSGAAEETISWMQTNLASAITEEIVEQLLISPAGQELAGFVFSQRIHSDATSNTFQTSSESPNFVSAPDGPVVTNVPISESGRAIVFLSAHQSADVATFDSDPDGQGSYISVEVTGDSSRSANEFNGRLVQLGITDSDENVSTTVLNNGTKIVYFDNLNPGNHNFEMMYTASFGSKVPVSFRDRVITVMGL